MKIVFANVLHIDEIYMYIVASKGHGLWFSLVKLLHFER